MKFCPNCGNQVDDSAKVCGYCGTPFAQPAQPETPAQPQYQQPVQPQYEQPAQPQYEQPAQPQYQQPAQTQYQQPAQTQYQQQAAGYAPMYGQPQQVKTGSKKTGIIIGIIALVVIAAVAITLILVLGGGSKAFTLEEGVGSWTGEVSIDMGDVLKKMGNSEAAAMFDGQDMKFVFTLNINSDGNGTIRGEVDADSFRSVMREALKKSGIDDSMLDMYLSQLSPSDMFDSSDLSTSIYIKDDMLYGSNSDGALSNGAKLEFKGSKLVLNKPEGNLDNEDMMAVMFPMTFTKK